MINKVYMYLGALMFVLGLGGMGSACEGQGSFLISAIVFAAGLALSLFNLVEGTDWE